MMHGPINIKNKRIVEATVVTDGQFLLI
jgi:hypothetical protein